MISNDHKDEWLNNDNIWKKKSSTNNMSLLHLSVICVWTLIPVSGIILLLIMYFNGLIK
jgi:hypothetical protein